jgi:hypothetical protein
MKTPTSNAPPLYVYVYPTGMEQFPDALAQVRDRLAQGATLNLDTCRKAAQPFGLHSGAFLVEFVDYVEKQTGMEVTR